MMLLIRCAIRFVLLALLAAAALASAQTASNRLALVIGNDNYLSVSRLTNARNDAHLMATALREASFDVTLVSDLDQRRMWREIEAFQGRIRKGDDVVFFFAGHGVQLGSEPVLLPVDIVAESDAQVLREAVPLAKVQDMLKDARLALLVIDACRDNPFPPRGTRALGGARGLAGIEAADGSAIIMSASRGQRALDSVPGLTTDNGLFTFEFVRALRVPGADLRTVLQDVRERVEDRARRVNAAQRPALVDETRGTFYFFPPKASAARASNTGAAPAAPIARVQSTEEAEQEYWNLIRDSRDREDFNDYLKRYSNGRFAALAQRQLRVIGSAAAPSPAAPVVATPVAAAPTTAAPLIAAATPAPRPSLAATSTAAPKPSATPAATAPTSAAAPQEGTLAMLGARFVGRYVQEGPQRQITGTGEMLWDNRDVYKGSLKQGQRDGQGEMIWASGQSYRGQWVRDLPTGQGTMRFANGDVYTGMLEGGISQGFGRMVYASGDVYEGQHERGKAQGQGQYVWKNGQRYQGLWQADQPHGAGRMEFANGNTYEGEVVAGSPQGQGTMRFASGDEYVGSFEQGSPHRSGRYRWKSGDVYDGQWQAGQKHGQGRLVWANGDAWQGEYRNDQQTERGTLTRRAQ
jgi:uncharacterized caspase-like protein